MGLKVWKKYLIEFGKEPFVLSEHAPTLEEFDALAGYEEGVFIPRTDIAILPDCMIPDGVNGACDAFISQTESLTRVEEERDEVTNVLDKHGVAPKQLPLSQRVQYIISEHTATRWACGKSTERAEAATRELEALEYYVVQIPQHNMLQRNRDLERKVATLEADNAALRGVVEEIPEWTWDEGADFPYGRCTLKCGGDVAKGHAPDCFRRLYPAEPTDNPTTEP